MSSFSTGVLGTITTNSPVLKLPEGSLTTSPIASCIREEMLLESGVTETLDI